MNIFLIAWSNTSQEYLDIALKLEEKGHKILYWSGVIAGSNTQACQQKMNQTIFHYRSDAIVGIRPKEYANAEFKPLGEDIIKKLYETEVNLSTMKLFDKIPKSTLEKKNLYHNMLEYWHGVITKLKPDLIIFSAWPHSGYNYVVYSLAKFLGVKTALFEITRVYSRLLLANDFTVGSLDLKRALEQNKNKEIKLADLDQDIRDYYESQTEKKELITLDTKIANKNFSGISLLAIKLKVVLTSILDFSFFKKLYNYLLKQFKSNLKKEYTKLQIKPDFNKKFIYLALHYQPECSTNPLGGAFIDQLLMIKILAAAVPDHWVIYVKEHPYQWQVRGLTYFNYRYEGYYKSIAKLKNVYLVPIDTDNSALIDNSQAVATITGTSGWEAALRRKPALVFGHAWYRDCPGVYRVNSLESCQAAIQEHIMKDSISEQKIINYLYSFDKISIRGSLGYDWSRQESDVKPAENTKNIFNALIKEIEK